LLIAAAPYSASSPCAYQRSAIRVAVGSNDQSVGLEGLIVHALPTERAVLILLHRAVSAELSDRQEELIPWSETFQHITRLDSANSLAFVAA
jgi:hypothetical protein